MFGLNRLMSSMMKEATGLMPPPPDFKITTIEAKAVEEIIKIFSNLEQFKIMSTLQLDRWIIYYAETHPEETFKTLEKIYKVLEYYLGGE